MCFPELKHYLAIHGMLTPITVGYGIIKMCLLSKSVINYPLIHTERNLEIFNGNPIQRKLLA